MKRYLLPAAALIGLLLGLFMVWRSLQRPPTPPILFPPPQPPYAHFVAGAGLIEAQSENIAIGTPFNDIITDVYVSAGACLEKGEPLFRLDTRTFEAEHLEATKQLEGAKARLEDERKQFSFYERLTDVRAVSERDYADQLFTLQVAKEEFKAAQAAVEVIETRIERSTIRAPIRGEVLKVNARVGQAAQVNPFDELPLVLYGDLETLHVRVDIDEEDSWRVTPGSPATAYVRGNSSIEIPLTFVRIEPYIIAKGALTGDSNERVDTRVLQVLYAFKRADYPVYVGQMLDVYLEAKPSREESP